MTVPRWAVYIWAAPTTLIGLVGATLADHLTIVDGVLEGQGPQIGRAHERVHVRQCERWGPFFVPAYVAASVAARLRGGDAYFDNRFEREAWRAAPIGAAAADGDTPVAFRRRADAT